MAKKKVPSKKKARGSARAKKDASKRKRILSVAKKTVSRKVTSTSPGRRDTPVHVRKTSPSKRLSTQSRDELPLRKVRAGTKALPQKDHSQRSIRSERRISGAIRKTRSPALTIDRGEFKSLLAFARKHLKGYEVSDGWSLRTLGEGRISARRIGTLKKRVRELRVLLAQPHDLIQVPTVKGKQNRKVRRELYKFTHQKIRGAKHFIVHKPANNFRVDLHLGRLRIRGEFAGTVQGKRRRKVITDTAFYLFAHAPDDEQDALDMLDDMLPDMPAGFYVVLTGQHGDTGEPVERGQLRTRLRTYIHSYQTDSVAVYDRQGNFTGRKETDTGFVQAVTGFRHLSTTVEGMELQMQARDSRRQAAEDFNEKLKKERLTSWERQEARDEERRQAELVTRKRAAQKAVATKARKMKPHKFIPVPGKSGCKLCGKTRNAKSHTRKNK